jgi:hypothetical protein
MCFGDGFVVSGLGCGAGGMLGRMDVRTADLREYVPAMDDVRLTLATNTNS